MNKYTHEFSDKNNLSINIVDGKIKEWTYGNTTNIKTITTESRVNVFYNYYKPKQENRHDEILYCLNQLLKNQNVNNIYVLCSDDISLNDNKLTKIRIHNQPKFKDFFNIVSFFTNEYDINIILNSDCYIDEKNLKEITGRIEENDAYLLTRWDI